MVAQEARETCRALRMVPQKQFELHLGGRAQQIYEVFPSGTSSQGPGTMPAGHKALTSAELLRRKQRQWTSLSRPLRSSLSEAMAVEGA